MSDFSISQAQRHRLLDGNHRPLTFDGAYPVGCHVGARYVLAWKAASATAYEDGFVVHIPRTPAWYLVVTDMKRRRQGGWTVWFEVKDYRDSDLFLKRGGGYTGFDELQAGAVPDREWLKVRHRAIGEFWHLERLKRHDAALRERSQARRKRAA